MDPTNSIKKPSQERSDEDSSSEKKRNLKEVEYNEYSETVEIFEDQFSKNEYL